MGVPLDSTLILSVGELNENKNHEVVIRAMADVDDAAVHYAIAGIGDLRDYLENLAKELGLSERVHLLGYRNDVSDLYKAADICAFPSIREGLGLAAVEGMASGLPLICSDNRGTREYAVDGENALVCNPKDVAQFTRAIRTMASDAAMRNRMGSLNGERAKRYDVRYVAEQLQKIYGGEICRS